MKTKEIWKSVPEYEGLYEVSNLGRVKSFRRGKITILKSGTMNKFGHQSVALGRGNSKCVHALVLLAFVGTRPVKYDCIHINGVGSDNRLINLRYGTRSENNLDMCRHGKLHLKPADVLEIRERKQKVSELALKFKLSQGTIYNILQRKIYAQI